MERPKILDNANLIQAIQNDLAIFNQAESCKIIDYIKHLESTKPEPEPDKETLHDKYVMSVLPSLISLDQSQEDDLLMVRLARNVADEAMKQRNK